MKMRQKRDKESPGRALKKGGAKQDIKTQSYTKSMIATCCGFVVLDAFVA
jgi:hypothetical protein